MERNRRIVRLKLDIIFKKMFGDEKNIDTLRSFLSAVLHIPKESITTIKFKNTDSLPPSYGKKFSVLDLLMTVDGQYVNVEMQMSNEGNFEKRSLFYCSRLYSSTINSGDDYSSIPRVICINIVDFDLFDHSGFSSHFEVAETQRHQRLDGSFDIYFFELTKIKKQPNVNDPTELWLQLINAETEEELTMLESTNVKDIQKAVTVLREMSDDERIQEEVYFREKQLHDEANAINTAIKKGRAQGEQNGIARFADEMRKKGYPEEEIQSILNKLI